MVKSSKPRGRPNWGGLSWSELEEWAGRGPLGRGWNYRGRVRGLSVSEGGALLAWVLGTYRYATSVSLTDKGLQGECTCPVGTGRCKHAVAVVLSYLDAVSEDLEVPVARVDDPRWGKLEEGPMTGDEWLHGGREDDFGPGGRKIGADVREYLSRLSAEELRGLLTGLARDIPRVRKHLEEMARTEAGRELLAER